MSHLFLCEEFVRTRGLVAARCVFVLISQIYEATAVRPCPGCTFRPQTITRPVDVSVVSITVANFHFSLLTKFN